jgi:hypothetical protein
LYFACPPAVAGRYFAAGVLLNEIGIQTVISPSVPARRGGLGLFPLYFDCVLDFSLTTSPQIFLSQKNSCDIYEKGVTNNSKNSSVNFLHSISTEKID